jgi:hypothetical protein
MFKKSNRNFRTKKAEFDSNEEDEQSTIELSSNNSSSTKQTTIRIELNEQQQLTKSALNKKDVIYNTILSFESEQMDYDGAEFKVKKSKESRRITKELKRTKKERQKQLRIDNGEQITDDEINKKNKTEILTSEQILFNEGIKTELK